MACGAEITPYGVTENLGDFGSGKVERMLRLTPENIIQPGYCRIVMFIRFLTRFKAALFLACFLTVTAFGQSFGSPAYNSPENAEIPVLIKHLPDWDSVQGQTTYAKSVDELKSVLGERPVLDLVDFAGGTEAVTAPYEAGQLLIIEYSTPQASIEADAEFAARLASGDDETTVYRRIGNYNAFVFDAIDQSAANALLDQVKYEKVVQWLGRNPYLISAERAFILTTTDIFISTVLAIVIVMGIAIFGGLVTGYIFFSIRARKRAGMKAFSDAGGLTRLNLDGLTSEISPNRLLKD